MSKPLSRLTKIKLEKLLDKCGDPALKKRAWRLIEELNPQKGEKILDAGCGDGFYLHLLSNLKRDLNLTGLDCDETALKSARINLKNQPIVLLKANLMKKLPFEDKSFDKIIASEVLEHLLDDKPALMEFNRLLKPKGIVCLTAPNANYPFFWDPLNWTLERFLKKHIKSGFFAGIWNQHLRLYKPEEMRKAVEKAGFKIERLEILTFWCLPFNHYILNLGARLRASGKLSFCLSKGINKYELKTKPPFGIKTFFKISEIVDKFNDIWRPQKTGVGIFVKARKIL